MRQLIAVPRVCWLAGSDGFLRSLKTDTSSAPETASPEDTVVIAIAYDEDGTIRVYRDGRLESQHRSPAAITFTDARVLIGRRHTTAGPADEERGPHFAGTIDEARIYQRALTANEIDLLYQQGPIASDAVVDPEPAPNDAPPDRSVKSD